MTTTTTTTTTKKTKTLSKTAHQFKTFWRFFGDSEIERLPKEIKKHYRDYSINPWSWVIQGDTGLVFLKQLREKSDDMRSFIALWNMLDTSDLEIDEVHAVYSPLLLQAFATKYINVTAQVRSNRKLFFSNNWEEKEDPKGLRKWTRQVYEDQTRKFEWNKDLEVPIIPAIYGTSGDVAASIIKTGFVALASLDAGYYGQGIYFTSSAEYALPYYATKLSPTVIISFLITGNAYPIIEHPKLFDESYMGCPVMAGYHSHYVLTRKDGLPCRKIIPADEQGIDKYYDEIVIEQQTSMLPFYLVKISTKNLAPLAIRIQKAVEELQANHYC